MNVGRSAPALALGGIVVAALWPIGFVVVDVISGLVREGVPAGIAGGNVWRRLTWTVFVASVIGLMAVGLAWPVAWGIRHRPWRWAPLVVIPMLLPSYFAYSAWGLIRAPGTMIGDWLARGPVWRIRAFEHALAMGGLAMWAWPIAAVVLVVGFRRIEADVLAALRLEATSCWARGRVIARMNAAYALAAWSLVSLVMLGSAVPLHVGQIETFTIEVWLRLTQTSPGAWWGVWVSAWPVIVLAAGGAWLLSGRVMRGPGHGATAQSGGGQLRGGAGSRMPATATMAGVVWLVSVVCPVVLLAWSLREWSSLGRFLDDHGATLGRSGTIAIASGTMCMIIGALVSMLCGGAGVWRHRVGQVLVRVLVIVGLVPGVLVGVALSAGWGASEPTRWMLDWPGVVVLGHVARFGFVGALVGWWLAMSESRDLVMLRQVDGADGVVGWVRACWPWQAGGLIGAGLAGFALGLHEIEASIMLEPPGHEGLARLMLGMLHFSRMEELSAGTLVVVGVSAAAAAVAAIALTLLGRPASRRA